MKAKILISLFCVCMGLSACSEVRPFVDSRREAGQVQPVGQSRPNRIAVCYNPIWDSDDTLLSLATEECAKQKKKPVFQDKKYFNCRFVTPNTAFYQCK